MEIKVVQDTDGGSVSIITPATQECVNTIPLGAGQSVTLTLPDVHDASGIQIGETEAQPAEPTPEPEAPAAEEPQGEPEAGGGEEPPAEGDQGGGEPTPEPGQ